jgi:formylglycine-generating enzyme required for sulfatase activity
MRVLKVGAIIFGALVVTTLGISATDSLQGNSGSLLGLLATSEEGVCPADMVHVPTAATFTCIDRFEASPAPTCPIAAPGSQTETQQNLNESTCSSVALEAVTPWTFVAREQAAALCARSGKRLPTAEEWYTAAIGTPDTASACNVSQSGVWNTGSNQACVAATGIVDAVGNVWEWVSDDVRNGVLGTVPLPTEGYVQQVDATGLPSVTGTAPHEQFAGDYFWSSPAGVYGLLRGGYYGNETDAGVFATQAKTAPTAATVAIGFRCVR